MPERDEETKVEARLRRAGETRAAVDRLLRGPTAADVVAFHELHARHLREVGDAEGAVRAEERAEHARGRMEARAGTSDVDVSPRRIPRPDETGADRPPDGERPSHGSRRTPPAGSNQVRYARAASQRADAALQRAVEASERSDAYAVREKSARARSGASRRRLAATAARAEASGLRTPGENPSADRDRAADDRERVADERERVADERDSEADSRDTFADQRDRIADRRDRIADRREKAADARDEDAEAWERLALLRRGLPPSP